jgi:Fe-S-cluster containining protein
MTLAEKFLEQLDIEGVDKLIESYTYYDQLFERVHQTYGFGCLQGCGACCHTPAHKIEVTLFEMLPMAIELFRQGKADEVYDFLSQLDTANAVCIHYKQLSEDGKKGYCTVHKVRPLICRLFAGGTRANKQGVEEVMLCRPLKDNYLEQAELLKSVSEELPVIKHFATQVRDHNPSLSQKMMPINEGLKQALDLILNKWYYYSLENQKE